MRLERESEDFIRQQILRVLWKYLDLSDYSIFFFGSRVTGTGDDRSDIDVGIQGRCPVPVAVWGSIQEEMEDLDTLYKIDVVDFATVSDSFKEVASRRTQAIYP